jgi:hypothetical protein
MNTQRRPDRLHREEQKSDGSEIMFATRFRAGSAWVFAVILVGRPHWPAEGFWRIPFLVVAFGLAYTGYSEWLNATVRQRCAYSDLMPVIPWLGLGLSPMLQWLAIPSLALAAAGRRRPSGDTGKSL